ncbi:S8 family serine peptidase [Carboxylicivirga taeanensis]|uniref:S8 family serine peptidase n=1 Tax=Carboxylicivirga taeanensis TaxID=1416875 RepID=UPI003F6DCE15
MLKRVPALALLLLCLIQTHAQDGYFVSFTDKNGSPYAIDKPESFLSPRAIQRRIRQNIPLVENDLPVSTVYTDSLIKAGIDVRYTTKWLNGAIVFSPNGEMMDTLHRVSFIRTVEKTKPSATAGTSHKLEPSYPSLKSLSNAIYGEAWQQVSTVNGHYLHQAGYTGKGLHIAVIDAGFYKANELPLTQHLWDAGQILGTKDFVQPNADLFTEDAHGMYVLSILAGQQSHQYYGTAPDAAFWLLRTEDAGSEHPIEPDYWVCAAELADSAGVDIISTSLGYYEFDAPSTSYTYADMNAGSRASRASDIASSKGMLVITSGGNEGNSPWRYIGVPADAQQCLAVGAIEMDSTRAAFSSVGPTPDGRIKPEVSALGVAVAVQNEAGGISRGNGTSFSTPLISGLAACLWQSFPEKSAEQIRQLIMDSGHLHAQPNNELGYGIPNFAKAGQGPDELPTKWHAAPNPFNKQLVLKGPLEARITISIVDVLGNLKYQNTFQNASVIRIPEAAALANGIYIVTIANKHTKQHVKVIKSR